MMDAILALVAATALLLGSPGPAPLALAGTSAAHGVRASMPFLFGILCGLTVAIIGAVAGLAALFEAVPVARVVMQVLGTGYICYIAWKIASAPAAADGRRADGSPPRFIDGFMLNLLSPKAYAAFLAIFSQFLLPWPEPVAAFASTALICLAVAAVVDGAWLCFGGVLGPLFRRPRQARVLHVCFAVAMIGAVVWAFAR